jgi:hypothetical protein
MPGPTIYVGGGDVGDNPDPVVVVIPNSNGPSTVICIQVSTDGISSTVSTDGITASVGSCPDGD